MRIGGKRIKRKSSFYCTDVRLLHFVVILFQTFQDNIPTLCFKHAYTSIPTDVAPYTVSSCSVMMILL